MSSVYDPNSPAYNPSENSLNSMSSDYLVPPPPPPGTSTSSDNSDIQVNDISELENIEKMLEKTKTKRDDGIELIINTDESGDKSKKSEGDIDNGNDNNDNGNNDSGEKKTVKFD
jgi:hypothetical protein